LRHDEDIQLHRGGLRIWGYSPKGRFVCRVEVNGAGLALYSGVKGRKKIANATWEKLVDKLTKTKPVRRKRR